MIAHKSPDGRTESVKEHILKTKMLCEIKGKRCGMSQIMSLCATLHDIGKEKIAFEQYLESDEITRHRLKGSVAHASTGAKYLYDNCHAMNGNEEILKELMSYCIAAHHGLFDCVNKEQEDKFSEKITTVENYDEACENAKNDFLNEYNLENQFQMAYQEFQKILFNISKVLNSREESLFYISCLQRLMLSILIDSDWEATSSFMDNEELKPEKPEERYIIFEQAIVNFDN